MATSNGSRGRRCLSLKEKAAVLNDLDARLSYTEIQLKYGFKNKSNISGMNDLPTT